MRWLCRDPNNRREERARQKKLQEIDRWWADFQAKLPELDALFSGESQWDLPQWMNRGLRSIDSNLMWEFGPGLDGDRRLVITPESQQQLRPLVLAMLSRAPKLEGWSFHGRRLADPEQARNLVEARVGRPLAAETVKVTPGDRSRLDVTYWAPGYTDPEDQNSLQEAFVACEAFLGEENLDVWVGAISVTHWGDGDGWRPVDTLPDYFAQQVGAQLDSRPDRPQHQLGSVDSREWTNYELAPDKHRDYAHQEDLATARTMVPEIWEATQQDDSFHSRRHSRCSEIFCYAKLDFSAMAENVSLDRKNELEESLDAALREAGVGCVVSGGTGLRYSYFDLAITNLQQASGVVRRTFNAPDLPKRSWLLFHDDELADEWIGLHPQAPAPPG